MRWESEDKTDGWRWRYALFPFRLDNGPHRTWVWLEWYQSRDMCLYTEVRLIDPAKDIRIDHPRYY